MINFRITYTYEAGLTRPSFRAEFERLAQRFKNQYPDSDDANTATELWRHLVEMDNPKEQK